jgi:hypothetical protein
MSCDQPHFHIYIQLPWLLSLLSIPQLLEPTILTSGSLLYTTKTNYSPRASDGPLTCLLNRGAGVENSNIGSLRTLFPA